MSFPNSDTFIWFADFNAYLSDSADPHPSVQN